MVDPVAPRRDQLEAIVGGDNRLLTALERLFKVAGEITPELLAALQSAIETNAEGIAENVIDIGLNADGIADNSFDIATNVNDILTNAGNIATNTAGIASNLALINAISSTQAVTAADSPVTPTTSGTLLCDASLGAIVVNLDPASSGIVLNVKKIDASVNAVTLTPTSGTIDGSISAPIAVPFLALTVVSNGTDWFIL
tara:strand:- start:442 stop:1038 length:597 start_codon:yes stop_codon:yes gene_type:complete